MPGDSLYKAFAAARRFEFAGVDRAVPVSADAAPRLAS